MKYRFVPMNEGYARTMIEHWKYPGEYAVYDYAHEPDHILDPAGWGREVFAVLDEDGELVGELTTAFFDEEDRYIECDDRDEARLGRAEMWIGLGLRPELTGRGLGQEFVAACIEFAVRQHHYPGEYVRLGVATFNQRAIKVYERLGFEVFDQVKGTLVGKELEFLSMRKRLGGHDGIPGDREAAVA